MRASINGFVSSVLGPVFNKASRGWMSLEENFV